MHQDPFLRVGSVYLESYLLESDIDREDGLGLMKFLLQSVNFFRAFCDFRNFGNGYCKLCRGGLNAKRDRHYEREH